MLLHLAIGTAREDHRQELHEALKRADDWLEYLPGCWLLSSELSIPEWYGTLKPIIGGETIVFIHKIEEHEFMGCLPGWTMEWLHRHSKLSA